MERQKPTTSPKAPANNDPSSFPTVPSSVVHSTIPAPAIPSSPVPPLSLSSQRYDDLQKMGISNAVPASLLPSSVSRSIPTNAGPMMGINAFPLHALGNDNLSVDNNAYLTNNVNNTKNRLNIAGGVQPFLTETTVGKSLPLASVSPFVMNNNGKSSVNTLPVSPLMNHNMSLMGNVPHVQVRNNGEMGMMNNSGMLLNPSGGGGSLPQSHGNASSVTGVKSSPVNNNGSSRLLIGIPYPVNASIPETRHHSGNPTPYDVRTTVVTPTPLQTNIVGGPLQVPISIPVPYILSSYIVAITAPSLEVLETSIRSSLVSANIDHEYSTLKWKAKCYVYKAGGSVHFTVQTFNVKNGSMNNNAYLLEVQRLRGSHILFLDAYQRFVQVLESKNIVTKLDDKILAMVGTSSSSAKPPSTSSPSSPVSNPVSPSFATEGIKSPLSLSNFEADPDNDPIIKRLAEQQQLENTVPTVEESSAAIAAFAALSSMLTSEFEDIACPAAHSLSAMSLSQRMRTAIGVAALSGLDTWRNASAAEASHARALPPTIPTYQNMPSSNMVGLAFPVPIAPPGGAVQLPPAPQASTGVSSIAVAHLLERLIVRSCMPNYHPSMPINMPRASIESRTACAIALANLSQDESCCKVLGSLHIVPRLLYSSFVVPHGAASAAFRRNCMKAVANVLKINNEACKAAIPQMCLESIRRMPGYREYPIGDTQFDSYCNQIDSVLSSTLSLMKYNK